VSSRAILNAIGKGRVLSAPQPVLVLLLWIAGLLLIIRIPTGTISHDSIIFVPLLSSCRPLVPKPWFANVVGLCEMF